MLTLRPIFTDGIVFAANKPIRIFGCGSGKVAVSFLGETVEKTVADEWCLELTARPYGGPYTMEITLDGEQKTLADVYVGVVLLLSGQSNIEFRMRESKDYPELSEPCPTLRVFHAERVDQKGIFRPMHGWQRCDSDHIIANTSAVGYETGLLLAKRLGCAIGLISACQGASVIQSWMPEGTMDRLGLHFTKEELSHSHFDYPLWNPHGMLYNTMLKPWMPYSVSKVVWYQGESNAAPVESKSYKKMLTEMIRIWRENFKDESLPFIVIQIANYQARLKRDDAWATIQAAQMQIQDEIANVKTVVCADVCEDDDIHPPTKRYLSERVADVIGKK